MSGWMTYFTGTRDTKKPAREAIITLRTNLQVLEKKEEYLQKKIEEELKKAKANAVSNKSSTFRVISWFRPARHQALIAAPQSHLIRCFRRVPYHVSRYGRAKTEKGPRDRARSTERTTAHTGNTGQ